MCTVARYLPNESPQSDHACLRLCLDTSNLCCGWSRGLTSPPTGTAASSISSPKSFGAKMQKEMWTKPPPAHIQSKQILGSWQHLLHCDQASGKNVFGEVVFYSGFNLRKCGKNLLNLLDLCRWRCCLNSPSNRWWENILFEHEEYPIYCGRMLKMNTEDSEQRSNESSFEQLLKNCFEVERI